MNTDIYRALTDYYKEADMVVIGIGGQLSKKCFDSDEQRIELLEFYNRILDKKNYFIVTSLKNDIFEGTSFNHRRIVNPFIEDDKAYLAGETDSSHNAARTTNSKDSLAGETDSSHNAARTTNSKDSLAGETDSAYNCVKTKCSEDDIQNQESATEKQWNLYNKWLSATLNHKLLIIETGEDFNQPNVFRWPFEKVTMINQKAYMYRIHSVFSQLPAELAGRATSVDEDGMSFAKNMKKYILTMPS